LEGVDDASKVTLRFGSWINAYIKLGAASGWDCFSINFLLKKRHVILCASVVDTHINVL
jgi:hypothetical protein